MSGPAVFDLPPMLRNGDFGVALTIAAGGVPLNITGWNFYLQIREQPGQTGVPLIEMGNGSGYAGITIADAVNGGIILFLAGGPGSAIDRLPWSQDAFNPDIFFYDMIVTAGFGRVVFMTGRVFVSPGVIR